MVISEDFLRVWQLGLLFRIFTLLGYRNQAKHHFDSWQKPFPANLFSKN